MADIEYRCASCGVVRVVSEFADATKLTCKACGGRLGKGGAEPEDGAGDQEISVSIPKVASGRLKLAKKPEKAEDGAESLFSKDNERPLGRPDLAVIDTVSGKTLKLNPKVKRKVKGPSHMILAFLVFGLIGIASAYFRYGTLLTLPDGMPRVPPVALDSIMRFGWLAVFLLNLIVVLRALSDNIFQGVLCLLIPGWSVYYLLFISDNFYLRAIVFGLLIAFAQDGGVKIYDGAAAGMGRISAFIESGGGDVRRAPVRR